MYVIIQNSKNLKYNIDKKNIINKYHFCQKLFKDLK